MKHLTNNRELSLDSANLGTERGCRSMRQRLLASLGNGLGPQAGWVQRHVANCPRCQRRLASWGKVELALSIVKSQPHRLDLLGRANSCTVKMLKHSLREAPKARILEEARPEPSFLQRSARYHHRVFNAAACVAILVLTRSGLFASLDRATAGGEKFMKQYYAAHAGKDIADEIFGS
jgi:anti-sigma factor RsiW